nr:hypothetical protein [Nonomuraea sp. SBT364]
MRIASAVASTSSHGRNHGGAEAWLTIGHSRISAPSASSASSQRRAKSSVGDRLAVSIMLIVPTEHDTAFDNRICDQLRALRCRRSSKPKSAVGESAGHSSLSLGT